MGSGYDVSKKNTSSKGQKTAANKTAATSTESAEHISPESDSNALLSTAPQANESFNAQELLGNQQVVSRQLESMQAAFANPKANTETAHQQALDQRQMKAFSAAPSLDTEEFWGQLFGGDPAPAEPNDNITRSAEQRKIPWLSGWIKPSERSVAHDTADNIDQPSEASHRPSALNRWAPEALFESEAPFTLDTAIKMRWHHPINQALAASRFIAKHSSNPLCQQLATIAGPFPTISSTRSLLHDVSNPKSRALAAQTAISLSLASTSIEIACSSQNSANPDIATSILLCTPLAKYLRVSSLDNFRNSDAQTMFQGEIEDLCSVFPSAKSQTEIGGKEPTERHVGGDLVFVTAALSKVIGTQHVPDINDPFRPLERVCEGVEPSGAVAELDAILTKSAQKNTPHYKIGGLITDTMNFSKAVSNMRYTYTKLAVVVWIACGASKYEALYASLKAAMLPIKLIARAAQIHLHLIELNIEGDLETAKVHSKALSRLPDDLREALNSQIQSVAEIAVANTVRSHGAAVDPQKDEALLAAISSIDKGDIQGALRNLELQTLNIETPTEQDLLLSTLRLAILFGEGDQSATQCASRATSEVAKLKKAHFHAHFAKIIDHLIRQGNESIPI